MARYTPIDNYSDKSRHNLVWFSDGMVAMGDPQDRINKNGGNRFVHHVFVKLHDIYIFWD